MSFCPCYQHAKLTTPGEEDFCRCGGLMLHRGLDLKAPRICRNCGWQPGKPEPTPTPPPEVLADEPPIQEPPSDIE